MSQNQNPKNDADLPAIPELTKDQLHRLMCADYLRSLANMVSSGQVNGFDLVWDVTGDKPVGRVEIDSAVLIAPLEAKIMQATARARAEALQKIPVTDMTEEVAQHGKCESPACIVCNNPNKA